MLTLYYMASIVDNLESLSPALCTKAAIHQVTTMLATSKNVLFPGHDHLLTRGTDGPSL